MLHKNTGNMIMSIEKIIQIIVNNCLVKSSYNNQQVVFYHCYQ